MSNFIPTTELVRQNYLIAAPSQEINGAEFDRWLAEVKAQAWEEGYKQGSSDNYGSSSDVKYADNPYRKGEK